MYDAVGSLAHLTSVYLSMYVRYQTERRARKAHNNTLTEKHSCSSGQESF